MATQALLDDLVRASSVLKELNEMIKKTCLTFC